MANLAEPVLSFLLENISKLLAEEGKFLGGVSEQAEQLRSKLRLIHSMLKDADAVQDEAAVIHEWIAQSKDLAYEAENALETFAFKVASRKRRGVVNFLKRYSCILSECYLRHRAGSEIQNLHSRITDLSKTFKDYGLRSIMEREGPSSRQQLLMIRRTHSHVVEEDFVGLESDVQMLVQRLVNEDAVSPYKVVSICGMGGLGKTTIARKVYNHPNVRQHFDGFAWVYISQQWQIKDILQGVLVKVIPEKREDIMKNWTEDELILNLYRTQQNKRCLIVLDDIWSTNAWERMKDAFPTRERSGSKMLLTTRNKEVAIHIGPNGFHHEPRLLSHDESWELLQKKALREQYAHGHSPEDSHRLEELGAEMVKYCGGLPLAIVVLGGILATKYELNEWKFVNQNIKSFLAKGENIGQQGKVQKILALSYDELPYQLKPCFLYLSIYPEDSDIEAERLYQLWMAEGMVSEEHRIGEESMMDVAERYLGELVKRCIVQVKLKEGPAIRKFESCRLHDLMRDLCLSKAKDENFLKVIDYRGRNNNESLLDPTSSRSKLHRLAIFLNEEDLSKYVPPKKELIEHVRSLTCRIFSPIVFHGRIASPQFNNFKKLRTLTIDGLNHVSFDSSLDFICSLIETFNIQIGNLIHLRYLCLRNTFLIMLPSSLGNLEHLETLDLRDFDGFFIRNVLWKMRKLRYLYLPKDLAHQYCKLQLIGLNNLEILENFSFEYCVFEDLCKLSNLQVLKADAFGIDGCEEIIEFVSNSHRLKQATLYFRCIIDDSEKGTSLVEKGTSLVEKLFRSNVHHLTLNSYLGMLPEYKPNLFENLIELELRDSCIQGDSMGALEKLPNLQRLWLGVDAFEGTEIICCSTAFPQLRFLSLSELYNLKKLRLEKGAMHNLTRLEISNCKRLEKIPDGLRFTTMLKELVITEMPQEFYDRVRRGGEDFEQVRHIHSILLPLPHSSD